MSIQKKLFDTLNGNEIFSYTITNDSGAFVEIITLGCRLKQIVLPDRNGNLENIVLGCNNAAVYFESDSEYFGAIVGRYANRIKNATYNYNGKEIKLTVNENGNHIHGGKGGFHNIIWDVTNLTDSSITFETMQADGTEGFPGNLKMKLIYTFSNDNVLKMELFANCDQDTIFNPTNHSYFNLNLPNPDANLQFLKIEGNKYTPFDKELIPTGEICNVPEILDFTNFKRIGDGIAMMKDVPDLDLSNGYDHNFIISNEKKENKLLATLLSVESGRKMEVYSNYPGVQFYGGNHLNFKAICLEPQCFPDSAHHQDEPEWQPMPFIKKNEIEKYEITYKFSILNDSDTNDFLNTIS